MVHRGKHHCLPFLLLSQCCATLISRECKWLPGMFVYCRYSLNTGKKTVRKNELFEKYLDFDIHLA